jgi:hypothetical protein
MKPRRQYSGTYFEHGEEVREYRSVPDPKYLQAASIVTEDDAV